MEEMNGSGSRTFRIHCGTDRRMLRLWRRLSLKMLMSARLIHLTLWMLEHSFYERKWSAMPDITVNRFSMLQWMRRIEVRVLHQSSVVSRNVRLRNSWREQTIRSLESLTGRSWCWEIHAHCMVIGCYLVSHWQDVSPLIRWIVVPLFPSQNPFSHVVVVVSDVVSFTAVVVRGMNIPSSLQEETWGGIPLADERPYQIWCTLHQQRDNRQSRCTILGWLFSK